MLTSILERKVGRDNDRSIEPAVVRECAKTSSGWMRKSGRTMTIWGAGTNDSAEDRWEVLRYVCDVFFCSQGGRS